MDYTYLHPRCVHQLYDGVILQSVAECRQAAQMLGRAGTPGGEELRHQLLQVIATLEQELSRRSLR